MIFLNPSSFKTFCPGQVHLRLLVVFLFWLPAVAPGQWIRQGSSPSKNGQVEGIQDREVAGAVECIAPHPTNANILFIGSVSGGIWKTENGLDTNPYWTLISADLPRQCIGALEFDRTDATHRTLVAGLGRFSSFGEQSEESCGVFRTTSGSAPWSNLDGGGVFKNHNITGIAAVDSTIVVSTLEDGIWRTTDLGRVWKHISGASNTHLPGGGSFDLIQDPRDPNILYTNAGNAGLYKTVNLGQDWSKISSPLVDGALQSLANMKMAIGNANNIYVAIVAGTQLSALFRSGDGGNRWDALDLPYTNEAGFHFGIHPGGQGELHLSLASDPVNSFILYIGGDRQVSQDEAIDSLPPWPNSLGAQDYSGRLFRIDASRSPGSQASALTHTGTRNNSAPHADSRDMDFDAAGNLIEGDDGGVFRRTLPSGASGDWLSVNGNLNVSEMHSVDWDANMNIIISGAQDIGTPQQEIESEIKWSDISTGDGGDVVVDDMSSRLVSTRYSSSQYLSRFNKTEWGPGNQLLSEYPPLLSDIQTGQRISDFSFVAPLKLHSSNGSRLLVATTAALYESFDQGNTLTRIGNFTVTGDGKDVLSYGATDNADIIYAASNNLVYVREKKGQKFSICYNYRGTSVQGIAGNPEDSKIAFVIDTHDVYQGTRTGSVWTKITGNLTGLHPGRLQSIVYINRPGIQQVAVGTDTGVYVASGPLFNSWTRLGTDLPNVPVFDMEYDRTDNVLVAGTMGMGAWLFRF